MDPNGTTPSAPRPLDDASLAAIVHDLADDWRMPPQRLDEVTWRDRVGRSYGSSDSRGSGMHWTRGLLAAAALAIVATVSLSYAAVWLTAPRHDQGAVASSSPGVSPSAAPTGSAPAAVSPQPSLVRQGELPTPSKVMVQTDGTYRLVDLATGTLGPVSIQADIGPATVLTRPGGGWVCICGVGVSTQAVQLSLVTIDSNGVALNGASSNGVIDAPRIKDIEGTFDPNKSVTLQPWIAGSNVTTTPDGRYALLGWVYRDGAAGWVIGVDVLDLATLQVTSSEQLTLDEPVSVDGRGRVRTAPIASVSADGTTILLSSLWYVDDPNDPTPVTGTDHWTGLFVDGVIGPGKSSPGLSAAGSTRSADCEEFEAGAIDKGSYYTLCRTALGRWQIARVGVEGTTFDTTELPRDENAQGLMLTTQTSDALFLWNPVARTISRFDFATAEVKTGQAQIALAPDGPLDGLSALGRDVGRLIAPSALAKMFFESGIVVSPDGRRIFALGIRMEASALSATGIDIFDADSLNPIGHWEPTADFSSIAINADGTAVYASAPGGITSRIGSPDNAASITVFDSASGQVRLLAGQLGQPGTHDLWFKEPVLR